MKNLLLLIILSGFALVGFSQTETLTWSDEFDGTGAPDPVKWGYDLGAGGWGNREVQTYTSATLNSRQENGVLIIDAVKAGNTWTSARLLTNNKFEFKYGRVVFRAKLPVGIGTWPALWMLGENFNSIGWPTCGEIDVMEHVGKDPGVVRSTLHTPSSYGNSVNTGTKTVSTVNTEFHNYQVSWTYNRIEFRIDSVFYYAYNPATRNGQTWPFDKPFFIIMNIAMGGNMGSAAQYETGGLKNGIDPSLYMARMEIDYVRVYQYPNAIDDSKGNDGGQGIEKSTISPNPTNGKILVTVPTGHPVQGDIYNLAGINVFQFKSNNNTIDLDISSLPKGLYLVSLTSSGRSKTQKIVLH
ncbi:MAG: family 16 glycosylhydrolase [bacterium]